MVKVETLKEDGFVRILRCREGNRIWYQMWLTDLEKGCIDRYFLDMEVKAWWLINLLRDGMFSFMRRMVGELGEYWGKIGLRIYLGVFCRYRPGMVNLFWASLCEHVWCVDVGYPLIRGAKISWYSKGRTVPLNLTFRNKK